MQRAPQSAEIAVTPESRSQSYVGTVNPGAATRHASISYMAQGRWYVLSDGGNGSLKGLDASYGAGTFNKNTGAFVVTLGALPDVGSSLILTWNVPTQETQQPTAALKASQALQLARPRRQKCSAGDAHPSLAARERHGHAHGVRHHCLASSVVPPPAV